MIPSITFPFLVNSAFEISSFNPIKREKRRERREKKPLREQREKRGGESGGKREKHANFYGFSYEFGLKLFLKL